MHRTGQFPQTLFREPGHRHEWGAARTASRSRPGEAVASPRAVAAEPLAWSSLRAVSARVVKNGDLPVLLDELVAAAIDVARADAAFVLLADGGGREPWIAAQRGLSASIELMLTSFGATGSLLLRSGVRPIRLDAGLDPADADFLSFSFRDAGFGEIHPLPLVSRDGAVLGTFAVLSRSAGVISERAAGPLDLLARQAADAIDRNRYYVELVRERARLRAIVDNVAEAIVVLDSDRRIRSANPAVIAMFGYAPDELVGRPVSALIPPAGEEGGAPQLGPPAREVDMLRGSDPLECRAVRRDGRSIMIEATVSEVEPGRLFTLLMRDVTERRAADARLRQADRLTSLGTLAAGLGHDMNNVLFPLRAHLNAITACAERSGDAESSGHVAEVLQGVQYLQQLADGLHYLVNDAGDGSVDPEGTRLAHWWAGTGPLLSRALPPLCEVEADVPASLPPVRLSAHALTQAVLNLFVNSSEAIAARPDHAQGRMRVTARASAEGGEVRLSISDNGTGMPEAVRARALDMFFTTKTRGLGTGLGLALVSRVARAAGGRVSIESKPGHGTTIHLDLPVVPGAADAGDRVRVTVSMSDGRRADLFSALLRARGFREVSLDAPDAADAWIIEPGAASPSHARRWLSAIPGRAVYVMGECGAADLDAWDRLGAVQVGETGDFDALLAGVDRVCELLDRRNEDVAVRIGG